MTGFYRFWNSRTGAGVAKTITIATTGIVAYMLREQHAKQLNKQDYVKENSDLRVELRAVKQQLADCQKQRANDFMEEKKTFAVHQAEMQKQADTFYTCRQQLSNIQSLLEKCEQSKPQARR